VRSLRFFVRIRGIACTAVVPVKVHNSACKADVWPVCKSHFQILLCQAKRKSIAGAAKYRRTPLNEGIASGGTPRRFAATWPDWISAGNRDGGDGVQVVVEADLPAAPGAAAISMGCLS
jgi:hypothetical protein